jgi:hypothetical protein
MRLAENYLKDCQKLLDRSSDIEVKPNSSIAFHYILNSIFLPLIKKIGELIEGYEGIEERNHYTIRSLVTEDKAKIKIRYKKGITFEEEFFAPRQWVINLSAESLQYNESFYRNNQAQEAWQQNHYYTIDICSRYHPLVKDLFHLGVIDVLTVVDFLLSNKISADNIILCVDNDMKSLASKVENHCAKNHYCIKTIDSQKLYEDKIEPRASFCYTKASSCSRG